jgi:hypothetical protein
MFREIVMVSVFCGLKFTSHFVDHACNFTRSSLNACAVSCGSSTIKYRLVSFWHKGLLRKLESIGIRGSLLSWVKNYLSERKQRVVINNSTSSW